ncbi:MAG: small multi-drug export protein [Acidimicrobiia bacterium]|nr:small multi-drug export protein [Acidimicrobiia bacterium]
MLLAGLVVAIASFVSGGFAIPLGFALGLEPLEVYLFACLGSMLGLVVFLYAGDSVRSWLRRRRDGDDEGEEDEDADEPASIPRLQEIVDRWGAKGLGLVGPIFPGVTASVVIGLALGLPRGAIARWMSLGVAVMFAVYTAGLWLLIELVGVD